VVDEFFTQVSDSTLLNVPGVQPLRKQLLERARRYYQDFLARHGDDPLLGIAHAEAQFRLGRVISVIDSKEAGLRQMQTAQEACEELLRKRPDSALVRQNLATCRLAIGRLQYELGRTADALRSLEAGRAVLDELYRTNPRASELASSLGFAWADLGRLHRDLAQLDQAAACYDRARALALDEARIRPTASSRREVVRCQYSLALVDLARGRLDAARSLYRQAVQGAEQLVKEDRTGMENRELLAGLYSGGGAFGTNGRAEDPLTREDFEKMRTLAEKARGLLTGLAEESPAVIQYRVSLAIALHNLGRTEQLLQRYPEAIRAYTEAADRLARVLREDPTLFSGHLTLADVRDRLGECQLQAGRPADAQQTLEQARAALDDLLRQHPRSLAVRSSLTRVLAHWAQAAETQGRKEAALTAWGDAASHQRAVCAAAPAEVRYREELIWVLTELTRLRGQLRRAAEAAATCRERLSLSAGNAAALYGAGRDLVQVASLMGPGQQRKALLEEAVRALALAVEAGFADLARWEKDPALVPLRDNAEIRRLHQRVQARAPRR
jgi:tetratricopeptide (TPR) repeat protein